MVDLIDREALLESIHLLDMDVLNRYEQYRTPEERCAVRCAFADGWHSVAKPLADAPAVKGYLIDPTYQDAFKRIERVVEHYPVTMETVAEFCEEIAPLLDAGWSIGKIGKAIQVIKAE